MLDVILRSSENIYVVVITLIYCFSLHVTGSSACELVHGNEDIIDLKEEPVEVSDCILLVSARVITNIIEILV